MRSAQKQMRRTQRAHGGNICTFVAPCNTGKDAVCATCKRGARKVHRGPRDAERGGNKCAFITPYAIGHAGCARKGLLQGRTHPLPSTRRLSTQHFRRCLLLRLGRHSSRTNTAPSTCYLQPRLLVGPLDSSIQGVRPTRLVSPHGC